MTLTVAGIDMIPVSYTHLVEVYIDQFKIEKTEE